MSLLYSVKSGSRYIYGLLALSILVNVSGLFVTIIGPDGALYASIAKTMVQRNNYIELFAEGRDWLDKPHFPFWITAFSFKLFGFTTWAYKLPALLFLLMGAGYTYAFARRLYNKEVAIWSVIILLTAEHIIISNNDVRAEPYLTGLIIAGIYHFYLALVQKRFVHVVAGAFFAACAVMTKGMFAVIPISGAIAGELIIKREWKELFHVRWLMAAVLMLVFITPELYCLYYQFDAQPQKMVFGQHGVSGIRFFFWDSQFGRFFNTGPIKGKGDPFFFVHTVLWAFLPWSVVLYVAMYEKIRKGLRVRHFESKVEMEQMGGQAGEQVEIQSSVAGKGDFNNQAAGTGLLEVSKQEWYTISGASLCFLVFSASRFQLPHYMNIVFPLFAIIVAGYVWGLNQARTIRLVNIIQRVICVVLVLLAVGVHFLFLPGRDWLAVMLLGLGIGSWLVYRTAFKEGLVIRLLTQSALVIIWVNFYLNLVFYPVLLKYQSGSEAAFFANKQYPGVPVLQFGEHYSYPLEFYLEAPLLTEERGSELFVHGFTSKWLLVYGPEEELEEMDMQPVRAFEHFHISRLMLKLVNSRTREKEVERWGLYLVERERYFPSLR